MNTKRLVVTLTDDLIDALPALVIAVEHSAALAIDKHDHATLAVNGQELLILRALGQAEGLAPFVAAREPRREEAGTAKVKHDYNAAGICSAVHDTKVGLCGQVRKRKPRGSATAPTVPGADDGK